MDLNSTESGGGFQQPEKSVTSSFDKPSRIWGFALSLDGISISLSKLLDVVTKAGVTFNRLILLGIKIFISLLLLYMSIWVIISITKLF